MKHAVLKEIVREDEILRTEYPKLRRQTYKKYPDLTRRPFVAAEVAVPRSYTSWMWEGKEESRRWWGRLREYDIKLAL